MDLGLTGRRALVTGSSAGLGAAVAKLLAEEGAAVVVHGRDEARVGKVTAEIVAAGGSADGVVGDLTTDEGAAAVAKLALEGGPVDVLVNNAGAYDVSRSWSDLTADDWAGLYNLNVLSSVRLIERLLPGMRNRDWGRVIQIGSVTGLLPQASQPHYAATNAARQNLAASLARELKGTGITSNLIAPGGMLTETGEKNLTALGRSQGWGDTWDEIEPTLVQHLAPNDTGRIARLHEVAAAVAYLASPVSAYITGATLRVDGGWYDAPAA
ncbi:NAD(P)-dependent dehydrogenase (short-subunit alcohol dehydrogenase family) [Kribbella amoyensis]|uniref:NAD(P)-dependent dehydrogenase (Short-subunit alcohol dehydrogenase family) n=1 Tax=Kribbella amoyensis TaxID=996641 RepID=A0A561BLS3_9ACTN|nr:SDR family NAD(P)-dependent oxidoreductase [Kribbella amoyensis]TWD79809.1 NAD(P)-dependent dehydrogenase (short-subunit alcohol dehydrogenase family) [Kribbella amoyensis]